MLAPSDISVFSGFQTCGILLFRTRAESAFGEQEVKDSADLKLDWLLKCKIEELIASVLPMSAKNCEQIVRSGRIEARTGLRMMPTFPRSSLSFRTAGFPQYGWKVGFPSGAFLDRRQLKPAPGMRCPPSSLHPPFVHLGVNAVIPHCVGPQTRLRTAMEGYYSSTPGVLARVRVIVSRSVITYATPSVPLVGTPRFHRKAAYTRCLRCAGAPRRPTSGSGLSLLIPS